MTCPVAAKRETPVKANIVQTCAARLELQCVLQVHIDFSDVLRKGALDRPFFLSRIEDVPEFVQFA